LEFEVVEAAVLIGWRCLLERRDSGLSEPQIIHLSRHVKMVGSARGLLVVVAGHLDEVVRKILPHCESQVLGLKPHIVAREGNSARIAGWNLSSR